MILAAVEVTSGVLLLGWAAFPLYLAIGSGEVVLRTLQGEPENVLLIEESRECGKFV